MGELKTNTFLLGNHTQYGFISNIPRLKILTKITIIQGECNNLRRPLLGKSFTPLQRILANAYDDGIIEPRSQVMSIQKSVN